MREIFSRAPRVQATPVRPTAPPHIPLCPPFLKGIVKRGSLMSVMPSQGLHGRKFFCSPLSRFLGKSPLPPFTKGPGGIWHRRRTVPAGACPHFHDAWVSGTPMTNCFENLLPQQIVPLAERSCIWIWRLPPEPPSAILEAHDPKAVGLSRCA